jgi:hypothetical protein
MNGNNLHPTRAEELLAEVAAATCRVTGQCGPKGAFIDLGLDLWHAARVRLRRSPAATAGDERLTDRG